MRANSMLARAMLVTSSSLTNERYFTRMNSISPRPHFVYELVDPRDNSIFYVGITVNLLRRYNQHIQRNGENPQKDQRIREITNAGHLPIMRTIEQVAGFNQALRREDHWIIHYLASGIALVNIDIPSPVPTLDEVDIEVSWTGKKQRSVPVVIAMLIHVRKTGEWPRDLSLPMRRHYRRRYPEFFASESDRKAAKLREKREQLAQRTLKDQKRRGRV